MVRTDKAELGGLPTFFLMKHSCILCYRPGVGLQSLLRHPQDSLQARKVWTQVGVKDSDGKEDNSWILNERVGISPIHKEYQELL